MRPVRLALMLVLVASSLTGCSARPDPRPSSPASGTPAPASASSEAERWRAQSLALGRVLVDLQGSLSAGPEAHPGAPTGGTFSALVLGVDASARTLTVDRTRTYLDYGEAVAAAKREGVVLGESPVYASNRLPERLVLPVAADAAFVVFYPGDDATNAAPRDSASMSALDLAGFRRWSSEPDNRSLLAATGGWVTVSSGEVSSFLALPGQ